MVILPAPMFPTPGRHPFLSPEWLYEPSFAGLRCVAAAGTSASGELRTGNGIDCSAWFPDLVSGLRRLPGGPHVLDGEICAPEDSDWSTSGERSPAAWRLAAQGDGRVLFRVFDLLFEHGRNIMALPLVERRARLERILVDIPGVLTAEYFQGEPELLLGMLMRHQPTTIVVKRRGSSYAPGVASAEWIAIDAKEWQRSRCVLSPPDR